jgi:CHAT domain-containing protein
MAFLSESLIKNHEDVWLQDFLKAPFSARANALLERAIQENYAGDAQNALYHSTMSRSEFSRQNNTPGIIRSAFEQIYSLGRQSQSRECLRQTEALSPPVRYRWLHIQWLIERSICEGVFGNFDIARNLADLSNQDAGTSQYSLLLMRSAALTAAWHNDEGRFREGWSADERGLRAFWNSNYSAERAFQFYSDLALTAEKTGEWFLAEQLQREALAMLAETKRLDFQAIAHFHLALAAQATGKIEAAQREYALSDEIFASLPANGTTKYYRADAEIGLAELELQKESPSLARDHLLKIRPAIASARSFAVSLRYEKAWARLERSLSDPKKEAFHLIRAVQIGEKGFEHLKSETDRWEWDHEVGDAYRRLLNLESLQSHVPEHSLANWELYRLGQNTPKRHQFEQISANATVRRQLRIRSKRMTGASLLAYAVFPDLTVVWVMDAQGVNEIHIPVSSQDLREASDRFRAVCADSSSPLEKVKRDGSRLYQWLIAPVEEFIHYKSAIYVEADGFLSEIPWSALVDTSGAYFGQQHAIMQTPGILFGERRHEGDDGSMHALVANPSAVTLGTETFAPLPAAVQEQDYLQKLYPRATVLDGKDVTAAKLLQELPKASLFAYAGHARSRQFGGELIIQGGSGGDLFSASQLTGLNLGRTKLVVLAACSTDTAQGEISRDPNGLVRGFMRQGAQNVVASSWDVDSSATLILMMHFYRTYHDDRNAPAALKSAQAAMIASGYSHPYYWASFELFGNLN